MTGSPSLRAATPMAFEVDWRTRPGDRTVESRDHAGVGLGRDGLLCILLDGATRGRDSGDLARTLAREMVDGFVASDEAVTAHGLTDRLRGLHRELAPRWPQATASYLVVHLDPAGSGLVLAAGDCLLGRPAPGGDLSWITRPDTLANALEHREIAHIAADPSRHRLTRSFRAREFMAPGVWPLEGERELVLATDGFWADLSPAEQAGFAEAPMAAGRNADDCSRLRVRVRGAEGAAKVGMTGDQGNLYLRTAGA